MSKKKRKRKLKRRQQRTFRNPPITAKDRHHLCFMRRNWDTGYAKAIRNHFIYAIPVVYHRELHNAVIGNVPRPSEVLLAQAWRDYNADIDYVESLDVLSAIVWLQEHIPDEAFRNALQIQYDFLSSRL